MVNVFNPERVVLGGLLAEILRRFLGYEPGYAGHVVTDPTVGRAVVQQVPFAVMAPRCEAAQGLEHLVQKLLGPGRVPVRSGPTFWRKLSRWGWSQA